MRKLLTYTKYTASSLIVTTSVTKILIGSQCDAILDLALDVVLFRSSWPVQFEDQTK